MRSSSSDSDASASTGRSSRETSASTLQATSDARLLRRFAAPVIFVLATCASADRPRAQGIQGEGPLGNDAFLPVYASAAKDVAAGDEAFSKKGGEVAAIRAAGFEAWLRALSVAENGDCASRSDRATESIAPGPTAIPRTRSSVRRSRAVRR